MYSSKLKIKVFSERLKESLLMAGWKSNPGKEWTSSDYTCHVWGMHLSTLMPEGPKIKTKGERKGIRF